MKERGILFSAPMVNAILANRKTMTRRVVTLPEDTVDVVIDPGGTHLFGPGPYVKAFRVSPQNMEAYMKHEAPMHPRIYCPYGYPGDHLYVKETFLWRNQGTVPVYRADLDPVEESGFGAMYGGWKPSIFMPRKASRITLEITEVRVERVQDITEEDAKAEGAERMFRVSVVDFMHNKQWDAGKESTHRIGFNILWDSINKERGFGWDANPHVWVVSFRVL